MARTIQQLLVQALHARGFRVDQDYVRRYGAKAVPMRKPTGGKVYFLGKAGSCRVSKGGKGQSHPSGHRDALIAEAQALQPHRKGCPQAEPLKVNQPCACPQDAVMSQSLAELCLEDLL